MPTRVKRISSSAHQDASAALPRAKPGANRSPYDAAMSDTPANQPEQDFDAIGSGWEHGRVPIGRTLIAGALMGAANLVPGISGGTMVLACGLYAHFVDSAADLTRGKPTRPSMLFIALLFGAKFAAMGMLGTVVSKAVVEHRSLAYALFLGMTLAGTPVLWRVLREGEARQETGEQKSKRRIVALAACVIVGVALMAALAWSTPDTAGKPDGQADYRPASNIPLDAAAGAAAYSAMVLPGVSGGTLKLALGRYEPTVWSIGQLGDAVNPWASAAPLGDFLPILLPYVIGAIVGLVVVSNALKWLMHSYERPVAAVLLGVLWGSVLPIWPFATWPTLGEVALAVLAAAIGFAAVYALTRWENRRTPKDDPPSPDVPA